MKVLSIRIIRDLPLYTDEELKTLLTRLTLNMYGADVTEECATFAITERKRRKALSECEVTA